MTEEERTCDCGNKMHVNGEYEIKLKHLSFGGTHSILNVAVSQLYCPACGAKMKRKITVKNIWTRHREVIKDEPYSADFPAELLQMTEETDD